MAGVIMFFSSNQSDCQAIPKLCATADKRLSRVQMRAPGVSTVAARRCTSTNPIPRPISCLLSMNVIASSWVASETRDKCCNKVRICNR